MFGFNHQSQTLNKNKINKNNANSGSWIAAEVKARRSALYRDLTSAAAPMQLRNTDKICTITTNFHNVSRGSTFAQTFQCVNQCAEPNFFSIKRNAEFTFAWLVVVQGVFSNDVLWFDLLCRTRGNIC